MKYLVSIIALCLVTFNFTSTLQATPTPAEEGGLIVTIVALQHSHGPTVVVTLNELASEESEDLFPLNLRVEDAQGNLEYATTINEENVELELYELAAGNYTLIATAADDRVETQSVTF